MKIVTIVGARPQFIKAAIVSRAIREYRPDIQEILIHTGQHFDSNMSDLFFQELDIPEPEHHLSIGGGTHGQSVGRMIEAIEGVLLSTKPDSVIVYGDTNSTLAGALAASKLHVAISHVEAGLRSFNRRMPEEINRVLTDHVANLLFTPTETATRNLAREGISGRNVLQVGDVMLDAAIFYGQLAEQRSSVLDSHGLKSKGYILVTIHRAENTDYPDRLSEILKGFGSVDRSFLWPMHPRTKKRLKEFGLRLPGNIRTIEPVGYLDMIMLEKHAQLIATDSGGVQKEAYFYRVPCLTLRAETEWVETLESGLNQLVNIDAQLIKKVLIGKPNFFSSNYSLYGEGNASVLIARSL